MQENNINDFSKVGIYGLTYKEDVDDTRESPTLQFLDLLSEDIRKKVNVYDPMIKNNIVNNQYFDFEKFISDSDIIVIMNSHTHIKQNLDLLKKKIILDTKNITVNTYKL